MNKLFKRIVSIAMSASMCMSGGIAAAHAEDDECGAHLVHVIVEGLPTPGIRRAAIPGDSIHRVAVLLAVVVKTVGKRLHHGVSYKQKTL